VLTVAIVAAAGVYVVNKSSAAGFVVYSPSDPDYPQKVDFVVTSTVYKTAPDDPIIYPNMPGASHDHTFSCSKAVTAYTTPKDLWNAKLTNCNLSRDWASYWTPSIYADGVKILPYQTRAYYRAGTRDVSKIQNIPFGLRIVAGDSKATSPQNAGIAGFQCRNLEDGNTVPKQSLPPACPYGDFLEPSIVFPNCWDGRNLDSPDHKSHMSYAKPDAVCDSAHPVRLPQLTIAQRYNPNATYNKKVTLATHLTTNSQYTLHADFMNAWDPVMMKFLTDECIKKHIACETISDDRMIPGKTPPPPATSVPDTPHLYPAPGGTMDMTAPTAPTNLRVSTKTATSVSLAWTASTDNVGVTGYRIYRGGTQIGTSTSASFTNSNLTASTSYTYTVRAVDAAGNLSAASNSVTVTTNAPTPPPPPPPPADTSPPTVTISAPPNGTKVVKGTVITLSAATTDNVGVTKVEFFGDGALIATVNDSTPNTSGTLSTTWNTPVAGYYDLIARAYDAAGNSTSSAVVNMTVTSTATTGTGDANGDGRVNAIDMSLVISYDGENYPPADFNADGTVGAADMAIVLSRWTW
jgi:chitodextrinase